MEVANCNQFLYVSLHSSVSSSNQKQNIRKIEGSERKYKRPPDH